MAWATSNRSDVRLEVQRRLYATQDVLSGTASSGSTTTILDVASTDTVTLESAYYKTNQFVGSWVYVGAVTAPNQSRVTQYDRDSGTLTLSPALGATASAQVYEVHPLLPPRTINDFILIRAQQVSPSLSTIAEATAINIEKLTLAEGVLADCLRAIAKTRRGTEREVMLAEADHHEMLFQIRVKLEGFPLTWASDRTYAIEPTEQNLTLRRS